MDIDRYSSRGLECICGNLRMASRAVTSVYDSHLREAGLQASQMAVLWAVAGMPGSGIKDIAKRIAMDESAHTIYAFLPDSHRAAVFVTNSSPA